MNHSLTAYIIIEDERLTGAEEKAEASYIVRGASDKEMEDYTEYRRNERDIMQHPMKRRGLSTAGKKYPLKRRLSSDEETETAYDLDICTYAPGRHHSSNLRQPSFTFPRRQKELSPDHTSDGMNESSEEYSMYQPAVVYERRYWEGEIV